MSVVLKLSNHIQKDSELKKKKKENIKRKRKERKKVFFPI